MITKLTSMCSGEYYWDIGAPIFGRKNPGIDECLDIQYERYIDVEFEGHKFMSRENYDSYLRFRYGDYMTLPPENERLGHHHASILDFGEVTTEDDR